ncbi:MAG TPA: dihydroorotate dehydrogenase [Candidatus Limnocylindrales bacterium]|nr:dihydroorotate dehydrogenase [Candidatus Limnocylindrales bacterium]
MPWRRPRKPVESAGRQRRSVEESLEHAAEREELDDAGELAALDGATIAEAALGEAEPPEPDSELASKLRVAVEGVELPEESVAVEGARARPRRPRAPREEERAAEPEADGPHPRPEEGVDLAVDAARGLRLKNPVLTASGTFGQGTEYGEIIDVARLGAIVNKGTTPNPRPGNPQYRIAETPSGILNSIGLENPGAAAVAKRYGPIWAKLGVPVIVNVAGYRVSDYVEVVRVMAGTPGVVAYELNVSCPNVKGGTLFGCDPGLAAQVTRAVKDETDLPVIVKLTPNAPDVVAVAQAVEEAGADALTAINTILGMRIDTRKRRPVLGTGSGGLSGPAIRPIAVHITYQVAQAVSIPVIGAGGVASTEDALEFLMAGASAVQVGTATFADPLAPIKVVEGLAAYVRENGLGSIREVIGAALPERSRDGQGSGDPTRSGVTTRGYP